MKKSFIFASVVALVALFAASCQPKVDAPKARFGYSVDNLTVTFENLSKEAVSYAWDFGDGETSTAEAPKHTYKDYGDYTVKLTAKNAGGEHSYTEEINLVKRAIEIDGKFEDWGNVNAAVCEAGADAMYEHLYAAKFVRDDEFIYFYLEFNGAQDIFTQKIYDETWTTVIATEDVEGYYAQNFDFYMNCGDETTGGNSNWLWINAAADVCIEGTWLDQFEGATVHTWPADQALADDWLWENAGIPSTTTSCEAVTLANKHLAVEGKIMIGLLPIDLPLESLKIGVMQSDAAWDESGILPATTVDDEGVATYGSLIDVPMIK